MATQRSSSVAARARAEARERRMTVQAARRKREQRIEELADGHAVAMAMAAEIRARADRDVAAQVVKADKAVADLLDLEKAERVAELLGVKVTEVRAARRRARSVDGDAGDEDSDAATAGDATTGAAAETAGDAETVERAAA